MRWFKVAAVGVGILIALIIGWAVVGFVLHAVEFLVIAALVAGAVAVAIKVARSGKQISRKRAKREVRDPTYSQPLPRADVEHVGHAVLFPATPAECARHRRGAGQAQARDGRLARRPGAGPARYRQFATVSLFTAASIPSNRTLAPVVRPIAHMVSSAGLPMTVTAGVAFLAVMRYAGPPGLTSPVSMSSRASSTPTGALRSMNLASRSRCHSMPDSPLLMSLGSQPGAARRTSSWCTKNSTALARSSMPGIAITDSRGGPDLIVSDQVRKWRPFP
jgi:hypothetical protein